MVSLFHMSTQGPRWDHLDTGIITLNHMLDIRMDAIIDIQSVPSNPALWAMLCNLICSHLSKPGTKVILIETINGFEWDWLKRHPQFEEAWLDQKRICIYHLNSFVKLFSFYSMNSQVGYSPGMTLTLITNFHEIVELYRLQLCACHEESLVKHQIDKNRVLMANREKGLEEGLDLIQLPKLPKASALLRDSPFSRFKSHYNSLMLLINNFAHQNSSVVFLQGYMEPKYKAYSQRKPNAPSSDAMTQDTSSNTFIEKQYAASRLVLTPVTFEKESDTNYKGGSKLSSRIILYNDWYYKSPHFLSEQRWREPSDYSFVSVAKVVNFHDVHSINKPVFFDFQRNPFSATSLRLKELWFINLLAVDIADSKQNEEYDTEAANLSTLIQASTQGLKRKRLYSTANLASSPPITESQFQLRYGAGAGLQESHTESDSETASELESQQSDVRSVEIDVGAYEFTDLVIDGSDVELTGTIFDDEEELLK